MGCRECQNRISAGGGLSASDRFRILVGTPILEAVAVYVCTASLEEHFMHSWKKAFLYGLLTWLIPFALAVPFYSKDGGLSIDIFLFKSIMIVFGSLVGLALIVSYFKGVDKAFLREGVLVGSIWLVMNWVFDFIFFVLVTKMDVGTYFVQVGMRYLTIPIYSIAIGALLKRKLSG